MMSEKKKKRCRGNWNGLLPILVLSHDTMFCIMKGRAWEAAEQAHMARQDTATTQPTCKRGERQRAHAWPGRWGVSRYKWLYRDRRGRPYVTTQRTRGCDTAQQCATIRRKELRHGAQCARDRGLCCDTNFVS